MTLEQYLSELAGHLTRLSPAERAEALGYYREYAAEAGITDYAGMAAHFGSPRTLAAGIYAESASRQAMAQGGATPHSFVTSMAALAVLPLSLPVLFVLATVAFALIISLGAVLVSLVATAVALAGAGLFTFLQSMLYLIPFRAGPLLMSLGGGLVLMTLGGAALWGLLWLARFLMTRGTLAVSHFIKRRTRYEV